MQLSISRKGEVKEIMNATQEFRDERVAALRRMADWLESTPVDLPIPRSICLSVYSGQMTAPNGISYNLDSQIGMALVANAAGNVDKEVSSNFFKLVKTFGGGVSCEWVAYREAVCEKVVIGTKVVPAEPARVVEAVPERVEDVVEWRCPSLLKAGASAHVPQENAIEAPVAVMALTNGDDDIPF